MTRLLRPVMLHAAMIAMAAASPANFYQVDAKVWRSAQPTAADLAELQGKGFTGVLSLREYHDDVAAAKKTSLRVERVRMNAGDIPETELVRAVGILKNSRGPILVHCWHGSDRTGTVVALYRMAVQGWPRDKAIAEFIDPKFGYHSRTYPNLRHYLENVDVDAVRTGIGMSPRLLSGGRAHAP